MTHEPFMQLAIDACRRGIAKGQTPFGACIVRGSEIIVATHNHVWLNTDVTAHAEIHAIRSACTKLNSVRLDGCDIYSTTEPCPMCFSAIHWAGMRRIIFGAAIDDAKHAGFNELPISNERMRSEGGTKIDIVPGVMRSECLALFEEWRREPNARTY